MKVTQVSFGAPSIATFFPFVKKIMPSLSVPAGLEPVMEIKRFLEETVKEHLDTYDPENLRDFIDAYIHEIKVCYSC
jgi:hypothetical protein